MSDNQPEPEPDHEIPDGPPPEMTVEEQLFAFKRELEMLVDRWMSEFDLPPEAIIGCMDCQRSLMLADMTMCYIGSFAMEEDDEGDIERLDDDEE
jgi:hypothetical protein